MKFSLRHQSKGFLYTYVSQTLFWMFANHFRRIHVHNSASIPTDRPVLLAANHTTAFVDPVLLGHISDAPVYNMTRGDMFENATMRRIFESFNMFPVFRSRDGYTDANRNDPVVAFCRDRLSERRIVCVYVEGQHHTEKRVLTTQKGIARIAFDAYEKLSIPDLEIIPLGVNYFYPDRPRNTVMFNVGPPLYVRDYWATYQEKPAAAILHLCRDIEARLKSLCYHVADQDDDALAEMLLTMHRSDHPDTVWPIRTTDFDFFQAEKQVLDRLNDLDNDTKLRLQQSVMTYFSNLERAGLSDAALVNPQWSGFGWWLFLMLGLPLFLVGFVTQTPVNLLAARMMKKIKKREFKSSIYMGISHFTGMFLYLILLIAALCTASPLWIGLALSLPVLGWFSMFYKEIAYRSLLSLKSRFSRNRAKLLSNRQEVRSIFK